MNFAQPLGTQHASKLYTSSALKSITVLYSANYKVTIKKTPCVSFFMANHYAPYLGRKKR